jgi:hypothetical protein
VRHDFLVYAVVYTPRFRAVGRPHRHASGGGGKKAKKQFFFEKKNQKTFMPRSAGIVRRDSIIKVFCFFSSEKKAFLARGTNIAQDWPPR